MVADLHDIMSETQKQIAAAEQRKFADRLFARRQLDWIMFALNDLLPGVVCVDTKCATGDPVPHMASDGRDHPHPYGLISTSTHEWRRQPWWRRG